MQAFSNVFLDDRVPLALIVLTAETNYQIRVMREQKDLPYNETNYQIRVMREQKDLPYKRLSIEDVKCLVKALEDLGYILYRNSE